MMNISESFITSLSSTIDVDISFNITHLTYKNATDLLQKYLLNQKLSNIRYLYGSLVLEFGDLNENSKGEFSIVCECDRKIQKNHEILCHGNMEKEDINGLIFQYNGKILADVCVIEQTGEIYLSFGDLYLTTLSTYKNHIGRQLWFNKIGNGYEQYVNSDIMGMYLYHKIKKSTEI